MCTEKRVIVLVFFFQGSITLPKRMNFGNGGSEVPSSKCVLFYLSQNGRRSREKHTRGHWQRTFLDIHILLLKESGPDSVGAPLHRGLHLVGASRGRPPPPHVPPLRASAAELGTLAPCNSLTARNPASAR